MLTFSLTFYWLLANFGGLFAKTIDLLAEFEHLLAKLDSLLAKHQIAV